MKLKILLKSVLIIIFIIGCGSKKTLKMTEEDIYSLDSLGYKVYQYKKDSVGVYKLDTTESYKLKHSKK